ncbi:MAG TPA: hypothetical protein V6D05_00170 [Stenomitos sp.]
MNPNNRLMGVVLGLAIAGLAGCGQAPTGVRGTTNSQVAATSTAALKAGFTRVHQAIFAKLDANHDGTIDEYEAGPTIPLNIFTKLDRNGDGSISQEQFIEFATAGGFFTGNDTEDKFFVRMRDYLATAFTKLDQPVGGAFSRGDGFLSREELSDKALAKLGLGFRYPTLNIQTTLVTVTDDLYKADDKTGDGKLSQGEFEDLYIDMVVAALK